MKTCIKNVALLDMRNTTPERAEQVEEIRNAAVILASPETVGLLSRMKIGNVGRVFVMPADSKLISVNGEHTLTDMEMMDEKVCLLVNGRLRVAETVTPEAIARMLQGVLVNGMVVATQSQMAALMAIGMEVNGSSVVYPDGVKIRTGKQPYTVAEAGSAVGDTLLEGRVRVERGVADLFCERGYRLFGKDGAIIDAGDREAFFACWQDDGKVLMIPEGFTYSGGDQTVDRRRAPLQRGKRMIDGSLVLREDVTEEAVRGLEGLTVTGKLFMPEALLVPLMERIEGEPEIIPYTGAFLQMSGAVTLAAEALAQAEQVAIWADGVLRLDAGITPAELKEKVSLLYVDGVVEMTQAQHMALLPVLLGSFHIDIQEAGTDSAPEAEEEQAGVIYITNAASYIL